MSPAGIARGGTSSSSGSGGGSSGGGRRNITAPAGGIGLNAGDVYRDVIINAAAVTADALFTGTGLDDALIENCQIDGLPADTAAAVFTGCTRPRFNENVVLGGDRGVTFDACDDPQAGGNSIELDAASGTGHGILFYANAADHSGGRAEDNYIDGAGDSHGIYGWGSDAAVLAGAIHLRDLAVVGNVIRNTISPIWFSKCQGVSVSGNVARTASDVGIDFEGCLDCTASGNILREVHLGGLAVIYNSKGIVFTGNQVESAGYTAALGGAGHFAETSWMCAYVRDTCEDIDFVGNQFISRATGKFGEVNIWKNAESSASKRVAFTDNRFANCAVFTVGQAYDLSFEDNKFYATFEPTEGTLLVQQTDGVLIAGNSFRLATAAAAAARGSSPIQVYQNSAATTPRVTRVVIEDNRVYDYPSLGIEVDTHNGTNYTSIFAIRNNHVAKIFTRTSAAATKLIDGNVLPTDPATAAVEATW